MIEHYVETSYAWNTSKPNSSSLCL